MVGQGHEERAAADRRGAKGRKLLYPGDIERLGGREFQRPANCETGLDQFSYAMLAGRTQSEIPAAADQVFVSALANGKAYIVFGTIKPKVQVKDCLPLRADFNEKAENAYKRCFAQRAPQQPHLRTPQSKRKPCWRRRWEDSAPRAQLARASAGRVWRSSFAQTKPSAIMMAPAVSKVGTLPACWMPKP